MVDLSLSMSDALAILQKIPQHRAQLLGAGQLRFNECAIDSRTVQGGMLFVALKGERSDGHNYLEQVIAAGCGCLLVKEGTDLERYKNLSASKNVALLVCVDPLLALQALAHDHLLRCAHIVRIGITGSAGKTTTKELTANILKQFAATAFNPGNFNSDIGLPLSIFKIKYEDKFAVFELGMNRKNEIRELTQIYLPQKALITNIGSAHIGMLGSQEAIAKEKKNIFSCYTGVEDAFVPADDEFREFLSSDIKAKNIFYFDEESTGISELCALGLRGYEFKLGTEKIRFPLMGKHNIKNACAAIALARSCGASERHIARGLETFVPLFGRSQVLEENGVTILFDAYNASPDSMAAALEFMGELEHSGRKILVLGDMLELGSEAELAHQLIAEQAICSDADLVFFYGEIFSTVQDRLAGLHADILQKVFYTTDFSALEKAYKHALHKGDTVLLKASRGMAIERLLNSPQRGGLAHVS